MLTLGHLPTIFRANKGSQSIPLPDLFDYSSRSGLNLVDALGGSNAAILGGRAGLFNNAYINLGVMPQIVGDFTFYFECYISSLATTGVIYSRGGYANGQFYIDAWSGGKIRMIINAQEVVSNTITINTYYKGVCGRRGNQGFIQIEGQPEKTLTNAAIGNNITYVGNAYIGCNSGTFARFTGYIAAIGLNEVNYYLNNAYNSLTGIAATNSGVTFPLITTATPTSTTDALADGYYQLSGGEQVVDPQFTLPVGAVNHEGGQVHNLISSYIDFPAGDLIMDRANTDIFNATCRASIYYDSSNPRRWHVSELNYDTMQTYLEAAYTNTRFASIKTNYLNQLYIDRFFAFAAPISGATLTYYLTLIGK